MNEQDIREIVRDEMQKNYYSGDPQVPPHSHSGNDGLQVPLQSIEGTDLVPVSNNTYLNPATGLNELGYAANLTGGDATNLSQEYATPQILATVPIPIVVGGGVGAQSAFNGGYAEDGTMVLFVNGNTLTKLNVAFGGEWYQFNVDSVI